MNEAKKQKGLWHNMRQRRKKGLPRKKPGQKGYPKTLKLEEAAVRSIVRGQILREWTFIEALYMRPDGIIPALVGMVKDMFAPTTAERLKETGDDVIIRKYQNFLGTLHMTEEYQMVWENYKQAQRRHASMDSDFDRARDIRHPVGRAFNKLKTRVMMKFDELDRELSPVNRDIWEADVEEQRQIFRKIFDDWYRGKLTTGRVLGMLDPKGIVESRRRSPIMEAGEMFWGKDYLQMQLSKAQNALETALMDLEDVGCPDDSFAYSHVKVALEELDIVDISGSTELEEPYDDILEALHSSKTAVRNCREISREDAYRIANNIDDVQSEIVVSTRFEDTGIKF